MRGQKLLISLLFCHINVKVISVLILLTLLYCFSQADRSRLHYSNQHSFSNSSRTQPLHKGKHTHTHTDSVSKFSDETEKKLWRKIILMYARYTSPMHVGDFLNQYNIQVFLLQILHAACCILIKLIHINSLVGGFK